MSEDNKQEQPVEVDFEKLTDAQLIELANKELAGEQVEVPAASGGQARDEQGRFTKADEAATDGEQNTQEVNQDDEGEEEPEQLFRYEIDLGDGGGKQVFEADSYEALIEKLGKAQEHATRKIRELSAKAKEQEKQPEKKIETGNLTADEEWLIAQEFATRPTEAFNKLFERVVGKPIGEFKTTIEKAEAFDRAQREHAAAEEFKAKHPEYVVSRKNAERMLKYMTTYQMEGTVENIEKAFTDLSESGLLETKAPETQGAEPTEQRGLRRPADTQRRAASGLSSRRSATPITKELTEDDLYKLPMDELERRANAQLRSS